jgi:hypothetical protein
MQRSTVSTDPNMGNISNLVRNELKTRTAKRNLQDQLKEIG